MHLCMSFFVYFLIFLSNNLNNIQDISAKNVASPPSGSVLDGAMGVFDQKRKELTIARAKFDAERKEFEDEKKIMTEYLLNSKLYSFNVGGEVMFTSLASLLHVNDSKMAQMIIQKSGDKISHDKEGLVFLDFNPTLFRHVLEQLRLFEDGEEAVFYPPLTPALTVPFNAMLDKLGLKPAPISDDDIFTFNVGDETIATKRKTLNRVPSSKLSTLLSMNKPSDMDPSGKPFLDYDPDLFRHLLSQLQAGQTTDFEAPSEETKAQFNAMLANFELKPK